MKKILLLVAVLGFISQISVAQDLKFGVRGGLNLTKFVGHNVDNSNIIAGPHIGAFSRIGLSDRIKFQPELLLSFKGDAFRQTTTSSLFGQQISYKSRSRTRLTYLDIPLLADIMATDNFGILIGIQPSILLGAKYKNKVTQTINGTSKTTTSSVTGTDGLKTFDLGLVLGLQAETEMGLDFGARFNYGFLNIADNNGDGDTDAPSFHNINIMLTVGYAFGGK